MEPSTLVRRSTRIASKNSEEPRATRACARTIQKENIFGGKKSSLNKNYSKSVQISLLSSTDKTILKSRQSTKSKNENLLPPSLLDVKTTAITTAKSSKIKEKENSKSSSFDTKKSELSISVVISDQLRRSKRRLENDYDLDNHRILASSSKEMATTNKELIENVEDKNKALVNQITYKKNEIVMAKMAGHVIWPAKVIFIFFHFLNTLRKTSAYNLQNISNSFCFISLPDFGHSR